MRLLVHDLETKDLQSIFPNFFDNMMIISNDAKINHCIGCFGCWIKTPSACVIRDKYGDLAECLSKCKEVIIISKCCYGGFSPFVKNVLDRCIPYIHPYFVIKNGEMHHKRRYTNHINMKVWFYGESITEKEKLTAQELVKANAINLYWDVDSICFRKSIMEMEGQIS